MIVRIYIHARVSLLTSVVVLNALNLLVIAAARMKYGTKREKGIEETRDKRCAMRSRLY